MNGPPTGGAWHEFLNNPNRSTTMTTPTDQSAEVRALAERLTLLADTHFNTFWDHKSDVIAWANDATVSMREAAGALLRQADEIARLNRELLDTTWQDHADHWQKRAEAAESQVLQLQAACGIETEIESESYYAAWVAAEEKVRQLQEALDAWAEWFRRTGDGSMSGKSDAEYKRLLCEWIADGASMSKEPQK